MQNNLLNPSMKIADYAQWDGYLHDVRSYGDRRIRYFSTALWEKKVIPFIKAHTHKNRKGEVTSVRYDGHEIRQQASLVKKEIAEFAFKKKKRSVINNLTFESIMSTWSGAESFKDDKTALVPISKNCYIAMYAFEINCWESYRTKCEWRSLSDLVKQGCIIQVDSRFSQIDYLSRGVWETLVHDEDKEQISQNIQAILFAAKRYPEWWDSTFYVHGHALLQVRGNRGRYIVMFCNEAESWRYWKMFGVWKS